MFTRISITEFRFFLKVSVEKHVDVCKYCKSNLVFLWKFFLLLSDLHFSWHFIPYAASAAKTLSQEDTELMMQKSLTGAESLLHWPLNGQATVAQPWYPCNSSYTVTFHTSAVKPYGLSGNAGFSFHWINSSICFVLQGAHIFIYSQWDVYRGKRMPRHCHSARDRART